MITLQFQAYVANEDSSVVSYKTFNRGKDDAYPTFTICLTGHYGKILRGDINSIEFEAKPIDLRPMIRSFETRPKEGYGMKHISNYEKLWNKSFESIFSITYHDPIQVCYTKEWIPEKNVLLYFDYLEIDVDQMIRVAYGYEMYFFVHQRGQLLRKLGTPDYV